MCNDFRQKKAYYLPYSFDKIPYPLLIYVFAYETMNRLSGVAQRYFFQYVIKQGRVSSGYW